MLGLYYLYSIKDVLKRNKICFKMNTILLTNPEQNISKSISLAVTIVTNYSMLLLNRD